MNKAYLIMLFAIMFVCVKNEFGACEYGPTDSVSEDGCRVRSTTIDKTHCCYVELDDYGQCKQLSDDEYENIKRYKSYLKSKYNHVKIKCSSQAISLFNLFLLFALLALF